MTLYVGLMSGTSLDGIDGVLADFEAPRPRIVAAAHAPFEPALREELLALNSRGDNELHRAALAANALAEAQAGVVRELLARSGVPAGEVRAAGSHGQTVRHRPELGYTLQLNNGALLAERSAIDVVCDLRSRDVAAGGQGAPLVPAFHAAVFGAADEARAVLNLGGIANITLIDADGTVAGFDTGPANVLLDGWCARHLGRPYDGEGLWAAAGRVHDDLLARLLTDPFFALPPPKSTGRDRFNLGWLDQTLASLPPLDPADVQATLAELTARTIADALQCHAPQAAHLLVCGGGAHNGHVMRGLAAALPGWCVETTATHGIAPTQVEAAAFAWLARAFVEGQPGNRTEVTGARGPRVLGALYPR